jgi:hypothetical protein
MVILGQTRRCTATARATRPTASGAMAPIRSRAVIAAPQLAGHHAETGHAAHRGLALVEELAAAFGQHHALGPPLEDQEAQLEFESADQAAHGGLAQAQLAGGARHRAGLADGEGCAQLQEIEGAVAGGHMMRPMHELIRTYHFSA